MKTLLICTVLLTFFTISSSFAKDIHPIDTPAKMDITKPAFPGGLSGLQNFLTTGLQYPMEARENAIEGKVVVQFNVMKDGSIQNIKVIKGIGFGCDTEAIRVIESMPNWTPAFKGNIAVATKISLPIYFELN